MAAKLRTAASAAVPTLEVVAQRAGVSRSTASRVLTGATNVSPAAREAVLRASAELGYLPNRAARSLVTRRTDSVAFVVSEPEDRFFSDPFFGSVLRGAHTEISRAGLQLIFVVTGDEVERKQFLNFASAGHVDGVVLISLHENDPMPHKLQQAGIPVVLVGRPLPDDGQTAYVDADNFGGGRLAAKHLIKRGCQRIVTIAGPDDMAASRDRLEGFDLELAAAGRKRPESYAVHGDFSATGGAAAMRHLLEKVPDLDGVFAANDLMAAAATQVLQRAGRRVPEDVAVVGYDDVPVAAVSHPPLTTVAQPMEAMGRTMARMLLDKLEGRPITRSIVLPTELVIRTSA